MKKMALSILLALFLLTTCGGGADHTTEQAETGSSEIDPAVQASEDLVRFVDEFFEREMELNLCVASAPNANHSFGNSISV